MTASVVDSRARTEESVYERGELATLDIGAQMRVGHVDVAEGDVYIVSLLQRLLGARAAGAVVVDIGSGSGVLSEMLAKALPQHQIVANDTAASNVRRARSRLARLENARVFDNPIEEWREPADVFISWGSHHHLSHGYLGQLRRLLRPGGRLIIGDEFCPEYLTQEELRGGRAWLVNGYLYTSAAEEAAFRATGVPPTSVTRREQARRLALWRWYRFVIDQAIARDDWDVALVELQIARDDLTTAFEDEHKTSPLLLETELKDAGFIIESCRRLGDRAAELESFVIYEASLPESR